MPSGPTTDPAPQDPKRRRGGMVVLVSGMSGAGRTTAINVLEDMGFEPLNNFPLSLVETIVAPVSDLPRHIALGIETRTRGFSVRALMETLETLRRLHVQATLVFLDCADETLIARFSETRRRHPLAPAEDPATGVARERAILEEVRGRADMVIDTSDLTPHELKRLLSQRFGEGLAVGLGVSVQSFSYKRGAPHGADMVLDCRFLMNPYWDETLRALDGCHPQIQSFVTEDPLYPAFFKALADLIRMLLPAYKAEGKAHLTIALGCTGGRHRSVAVAEMLGATLTEAGWPVSLRHRELERGAGRSER